MEKTKEQKECWDHIQAIHGLAEGMSGKLVLCGFGQNPNTGEKLSPVNLHFKIGDVEGMYNAVQKLQQEPHRNVYLPLAVMRNGLEEGKKGAIEDAVSILGINADFDDGDGNWKERCPLPPHCVIETSPGNFQCYYFFSEPMNPAKAVLYAEGLQSKTGCDSCTKDVIQPWRIPGTKNWPNQKKVRNGRSKTPFIARVAEPWRWDTATPRDLFPLLDNQKALPKKSANQAPCNPPDISRLPLDLQELIREGDAEGKYDSRSEAVCAAVGLLYRHNFGLDEIASIIHTNAIGDRFDGDYKRVLADVQRVIAKGDNFRVFSPGAPWKIAKTLVKDLFMQNGKSTLRHYKGDFYKYVGTHYEAVNHDDMTATIWRYLSKAKTYNEKKKGYVDFNPTTRAVRDTVNALAANVNLPVPADKEAPFWLKDHKINPAEILSCKNGLFHLPSGKLYKHTPHYFGFNSTEVICAPDAQCPAWHKFLDSALPDDPESISTLQEIFGYVLSPDTSQQKIFLWVGPKRSGKGTNAEILTALRGGANVVAPTLSGLGGEFGLWPLIGKPLAIIGDARMVQSADGRRAVERLLGVSGEDHQSVNRKGTSFWHGKLPTRFIISSNEKLQLRDASAVIVSRLVAIQFRQSFYGREDLGLKARLKQELPGILNWAVEGYRRLSKRGHFIQPKTSLDLIRDMEALSSPVTSFCSDACYFDPQAKTLVSDIFAAYQRYQETNGFRPEDINVFGRDLTAKYPHVQKKQLRRGEERPYFYVGIGLKREWRPDYENDEDAAEKVKRLFG